MEEGFIPKSKEEKITVPPAEEEIKLLTQIFNRQFNEQSKELELISFENWQYLHEIYQKYIEHLEANEPDKITEQIKLFGELLKKVEQAHKKAEQAEQQVRQEERNPNYRSEIFNAILKSGLTSALISFPVYTFSQAHNQPGLIANIYVRWLIVAASLFGPETKLLSDLPEDRKIKAVSHFFELLNSTIVNGTFLTDMAGDIGFIIVTSLQAMHINVNPSSSAASFWSLIGAITYTSFLVSLPEFIIKTSRTSERKLLLTEYDRLLNIQFFSTTSAIAYNLLKVTFNIMKHISHYLDPETTLAYDLVWGLGLVLGFSIGGYATQKYTADPELRARALNNFRFTAAFGIIINTFLHWLDQKNNDELDIYSLLYTTLLLCTAPVLTSLINHGVKTFLAHREQGYQKPPNLAQKPSPTSEKELPEIIISAETKTDIKEGKREIITQLTEQETSNDEVEVDEATKFLREITL